MKQNSRQDGMSTSIPPLAYLLTIRTYGSWLHGDKRGSVNRFHRTYGRPRLPHKPGLEMAERRLLKHPPVKLDAKQRFVVAQALVEIMKKRNWCLHAKNVRTNHVHWVATGNASPERIMNDCKSAATRKMVEAGVFPPGKSPWARRGSRRYLWNQTQLEEACRYVLERQGNELDWQDPEEDMES